MKTNHFFLDFDGTVASVDVVDLLLEKFAGKQWRDVEKEWTSGRIGSRECLARQIELLRASSQDVEELLSGVKLDPHFVPFLKKAEDLGVLVTIVSDGFDVLIEQVLKNNLKTDFDLLKAVPIFSNKLLRNGNCFKAFFNGNPVCEHGCANCKATLIKRLTASEDNIFFVGDGLSDRYAAQTAHLTFAKGKLLDYCLEKKLDHIAYHDFRKIKDWLTDNHPVLKKMNLSKSCV